MAATFDIELLIGDTRKLVFPVENLDQDDFADLTDVDDIKYVIIPDLEDPDTEIIIEKTLSDADLEIETVGDIDSVEFDDLADSVAVISVFLPAQDTDDLPTSNMQHELQVEDIAGNITTVMQGDVVTIPTAISPRQTT